MEKSTVIVLLLLLVIQLAGCATVGPPVTGQEVQAKRAELEMKAVAYRNLQTRRIEAIVNRLISFMLPEEQEKVGKLRVKILELADINARASWNELSVTYGMIRFTESDDEMAVVIAHELAHMVRGHIGKSLATNTLSAAVGAAAQVALDRLTQSSGLGSSVGHVISQGVSGTFSRDFEREADYYGLRYCYVAGFDILKGSKIWERLSIEAPQTMTANFLSSHPSSPERLIRAEKTFEELLASGIEPNVFQTSSGVSTSYSGSYRLQKTMAVPTQILSVPGAVFTQTVGRPLSALPNQGTDAAPQNKTEAARLKAEDEELLWMEQEIAGQKEKLESQRRQLSQAEEELETRRMEVARLLEDQNRRLQVARDEARRLAEEQAEFERVLLESKEASIKNRYDEFGIQEIGLAKKVTNLWVGQSIQGSQEIFPLAQGSLDWYVRYGQWTKNSWKTLAAIHRRYRAYWYSPEGKLFLQKDFKQSTVRAEFAKTTLEWDPALGNRMVGQWTLRVFEGGKLMDERTFEIV
ncbi:MAG: M48 family metalloprotease [Candidatus Omnitrophica bacterium]|nr:M48 family metalloprotease [Candidatus Omnitrophota bacterium]